MRLWCLQLSRISESKLGPRANRSKALFVSPSRMGRSLASCPRTLYLPALCYTRIASLYQHYQLEKTMHRYVTDFAADALASLST